MWVLTGSTSCTCFLQLSIYEYATHLEILDLTQLYLNDMTKNLLRTQAFLHGQTIILFLLVYFSVYSCLLNKGILCKHIYFQVVCSLYMLIYHAENIVLTRMISGILERKNVLNLSIVVEGGMLFLYDERKIFEKYFPSPDSHLFFSIHFSVRIPLSSWIHHCFINSGCIVCLIIWSTSSGIVFSVWYHEMMICVTSVYSVLYGDELATSLRQTLYESGSPESFRHKLWLFFSSSKYEHFYKRGRSRQLHFAKNSSSEYLHNGAWFGWWWLWCNAITHTKYYIFDFFHKYGYFSCSTEMARKNAWVTTSTITIFPTISPTHHKKIHFMMYLKKHVKASTTHGRERSEEDSQM